MNWKRSKIRQNSHKKVQAITNNWKNTLQNFSISNDFRALLDLRLFRLCSLNSFNKFLFKSCCWRFFTQLAGSNKNRTFKWFSRSKLINGIAKSRRFSIKRAHYLATLTRLWQGCASFFRDFIWFLWGSVAYVLFSLGYVVFM